MAEQAEAKTRGQKGVILPAAIGPRLDRPRETAPAIGVTTQMVRQAKWYKYIGDLGFRTVEINRQNSKLHFNTFFLDKVKRYLRGYDLSVHSGTAGVFQDREAFTQANLATLMAEIDVCSFLGAGQFVFHLKGGGISPADKWRLKDVIDYAADLGVDMLYESNSLLKAEDAYDVLDSFPELGYVLDLGHLNNGHGSGKLGCAMEDFVRQVAGRVVYVHSSNNSGRRDEHNGLTNGTLDWRRYLDMLDLSQVMKIIIEVRHIDAVKESALELMRYLEGDCLPGECRAAG